MDIPEMERGESEITSRTEQLHGLLKNLMSLSLERHYDRERCAEERNYAQVIRRGADQLEYTGLMSVNGDWGLLLERATLDQGGDSERAPITGRLMMRYVAFDTEAGRVAAQKFVVDPERGSFAVTQDSRGQEYEVRIPDDIIESVAWQVENTMPGMVTVDRQFP